MSAFGVLKKMNKDNWEEMLVQFVKFGIIGASNTIISTAVYYLFVLISPGLYFVGNVVGWIVSVFNSFFWNNRYVFTKSKYSWGQKLLRTYLAYGGGFIVGSTTLVLLVSVLGVSEWLAPWINLVITIPLNFVLNKFWAFKA
ncbi:MAG: GtrA family protein [Firmicutes bacterium]|nr:GtrA family protein [Bacillota bacterium]